MRTIVLGAAAGGGLPQWNCGCRNCAAVRRHEPGFEPRTQASIACSTGDRWLLLDASPDVRQQINGCPALWPRGQRGSTIASVVLTNGDIDHIGGLLTLRESERFRLYMTSEIARLLAENPVFDALRPECVERIAIPLETRFEPLPGLRAKLFPVPGKIPLYAESGDAIQTDVEGEQTVGIELVEGERRLLYVPGCAALTDPLAARLRGADAVFFDGTFWSNDEMRSAGVGEKTAARMGHLPIGGDQGSLATLSELGIGRGVYIHINNTNPIIDPHSAERARVETAGWTVGRDGMEFSL